MEIKCETTVHGSRMKGGKSNWDTTNFFAQQEVQEKEGVEEKVLLKVNFYLYYTLWARL